MSHSYLGNPLLAKGIGRKHGQFKAVYFGLGFMNKDTRVETIDLQYLAKTVYDDLPDYLKFRSKTDKYYFKPTQLKQGKVAVVAEFFHEEDAIVRVCRQGIVKEMCNTLLVLHSLI